MHAKAMRLTSLTGWPIAGDDTRARRERVILDAGHGPLTVPLAGGISNVMETLGCVCTIVLGIRVELVHSLHIDMHCTAVVYLPSPATAIVQRPDPFELGASGVELPQFDSDWNPRTCSMPMGRAHKSRFTISWRTWWVDVHVTQNAAGICSCIAGPLRMVAASI
jgi:hypothetical protein